MSEETVTAPVTPGQAAHLAWHRKQAELAGANPDADDAPGVAQWWYGMSDTSREVWEAAAQAAVLARGPESSWTEAFHDEAADLRALIAEILIERPAVTEDERQQDAEWRERAGLEVPRA